MRKGIIASAVLHLGILGTTLITWPHVFQESDEPLPSVSVELITVAEATNIRAAVREPPPLPPEPEPVPLPEPAIEPDLPQAEIEVLPEIAPEPEPEPEEIAEPIPEPEPPPPPRPRARPEPEEEEFDLDSVIALLDNRAADEPAPQNAETAEEPRRGIGAQDAMTMNLADTLRTQMRECWNPPIGAPNPEELVVAVDVYLLQNGELARPPALNAQSRGAANSSPYLRAAAESALRAVNICAPYRNLPPDQYARWSEITIIFDPARMAGR